MPDIAMEPKTTDRAFTAWLGAVVFAFVFTAIIWLTGSDLTRFITTFLPPQGAWWYPWQLPTRDSVGMAIVWGLYLANQFTVWGLMRWAQHNLVEQKTRPTGELTKYNFAVFGVVALFSVLHLAQTHIWFDGLAKDVPILTSQGSVIIMLAIVLVIENPRRGLILGKRAGKPFTAQVSAWFRHNHMYIIAWALVYTFWFHPMATDPQLLTRFFYMFLLFAQMSLAYTWVHVDKRWVITLEAFVAIHGAIVAYFNTQFFASVDMWPMFFTGFAFLVVFTYIYALKVPRWVYGAATSAYVALLIWLYAPFGYGRSITSLTRFEMLWIPIILYGLAALFAAIVYLKERR
jgi:hypothetical protein